jgi:hypothetical protein
MSWLLGHRLRNALLSGSMGVGDELGTDVTSDRPSASKVIVFDQPFHAEEAPDRRKVGTDHPIDEHG